MEYHKTKDILHVKRILGHKAVQNTMVYINLENALFQAESDEYHVRVAKTADEACKLAEVGYQRFDEIDGLHIYRKAKIAMIR